ncbi:uncharacterized protein P884DRAFT_255141 [Thermothelomyces heterothallicus CBS 202.75]|uniref:uncharacterized protein n=1 Tax=Thermothelomyces heterothallicus CBS 202.75 TaxID=1149848 RepID=UPI0037431E77
MCFSSLMLLLLVLGRVWIHPGSVGHRNPVLSSSCCLPPCRNCSQLSNTWCWSVSSQTSVRLATSCTPTACDWQPKGWASETVCATIRKDGPLF